jgi:hypothetical protein
MPEFEVSFDGQAAMLLKKKCQMQCHQDVATVELAWI